jgi:hypothetical protein
LLIDKPDQSAMSNRTSAFSAFTYITLRSCRRDGKGEGRKENGAYSLFVDSNCAINDRFGQVLVAGDVSEHASTLRKRPCGSAHLVTISAIQLKRKAVPLFSLLFSPFLSLITNTPIRSIRHLELVQWLSALSDSPFGRSPA